MAEQPTSTRVTVRYFAGARAAAGTPEEVVVLPAGSTVDDVLADLTRRRGDQIARVLAACSFLLDGTAVRDRGTPVPDGVELDVLPPFAGG
ncbi:MoaD/ThiS family protein [Streptoalloteichus hindustanus]|uniref:Molybdopterin synthase sulfur carrier subunit n=1 Tax=Streptoalloteichus hindustanus TaxID=2017 RepID=A0A1M4WE95_STRHI|nr:MoaD/ThiS family protein [Streptoalloteichus hindustanus]SHE79534.1 Molybdopterin converting factor, small subunit [Streptoalloteichus hindustanus]